MVLRWASGGGSPLPFDECRSASAGTVLEMRRPPADSRPQLPLVAIDSPQDLHEGTKSGHVPAGPADARSVDLPRAREALGSWRRQPIRAAARTARGTAVRNPRHSDVWAESGRRRCGRRGPQSIRGSTSSTVVNIHTRSAQQTAKGAGRVHSPAHAGSGGSAGQCVDHRTFKSDDPRLGRSRGPDPAADS